MDLPQKLAFVVQPNRLQGLIWQALLKSQKLSVILEAANSELADCITQISEAGLTLPDLIILDAETPGLNPYEFCRWCREHFPNIKVFLTRLHVESLSETERRWAEKQGASGFFDGFNRETLMSSAVASIKEILATLNEPFLDERALLTVLLNIRRQISSTSPGSTTAKPAAPTPASPNATVGTSAASPQPEPTSDPLQDLDWVAAGLRALSRHQAKPKVQLKPDTQFDASVPSRSARATRRLPIDADQQASEEAVPVRRYRGVAY